MPSHSNFFRACLRVGRDLRALDLLVAAGWNQAPARPAREWSMQAVIGRSCASQPPDWTRWLSWYLRTAGGSPEFRVQSLFEQNNSKPTKLAL